MDLSADFSFWFTYVILPLLIFCSRVIDVSLDTLRIVFISKGNKLIATILGFFEILIWLIAITRIMQNLDNISCFIAYAAGFATGNYVGLIIEQKLALGIQMFRIITQKDASSLILSLSESGYGVTSIEALGKNGIVDVIYSVVKRSENSKIIEIINRFNPNAFYSIEDIRMVNENGVKLNKKFEFSVPRWLRKGR
ncbi:MAG: DUF2179 domain-containing protein [Bacteroidetes bacterium]|nr:DUF2179 domain-containing protein [Bacteroidota bacterium]MBL6943418.1 DUF2179 domain-containing protein [Bacteroidales bacterium]